MKVLSIDFDIIMYPCIKLYNSYARGNENPTVIWNNLEHDMEIDKFMSYDANILHDIAMLMKRNVANGAKLFKIDEHDKIVDSLNKLHPDEKFDLVNIDFHHDISYSTESNNDMKNFDNYTCANWVGYLSSKNQLDTYEWIRASNSDLCGKNIEDSLGIQYTISRLSRINELGSDFSEIYFCLSPQWVPYKYHHLYNLICDMVSSPEV